jgi:hypothetical protein
LTEANCRDAIERTIAAEIGRETTPAVAILVDAIRERFSGRIDAILYYGSCLRSDDLRGVFDFQVIVERYREFYGDWRLAAANRLLPPNVFFLTVESPVGLLRAKVAVMSYGQFVHAMGRTRLQTSFWARFCQPVALVYARDQSRAAGIRNALVEAVATAAFWAARLGPEATSPQHFWTVLFRATYAAEFRAEHAGRARALYEANTARYDALTRPALVVAGVPFALDVASHRISIAISAAERRRARRNWRARRGVRKAVTLLRLAKAVFTFEGGVEYICWKIERHSGVVPRLTDWQRRHPILAGPVLAWRLYRLGAFR